MISYLGDYKDLSGISTQRLISLIILRNTEAFLLFINMNNSEKN